jgi:hypothetical protein
MSPLSPLVRNDHASWASCLKRWRTLDLVALLLFAALSASAQELVAPPPPGDVRSKLSMAILQDLATPAAGTPRMRKLAMSAARTSMMRIDALPTPETLAAIAATGVRIVNSSEAWREIVVEANPEQALTLASLGAVQSIRYAMGSKTKAAKVSNEADVVIRANMARKMFATRGESAMIGIISDSIHSTAVMSGGQLSGSGDNTVLSGTGPQLAGELPPTIRLIADDPVETLGGTDEGAAMMQLVYDLAPDATYAFASCGETEAIAAERVTRLALAGCTIICDDISFFQEPVFQDGPWAQAIDAFVASGGTYISSAGNQASDAISTTYIDVSAATDPQLTSLPNGADLHDWGIGGATPGLLPIHLEPPLNETGYVILVLNWNQPYKTNGLGLGSESDYDLWVFKQPIISPDSLLEVSRDVQGEPGSPAGDPSEGLLVEVDEPTTIYLAINRVQGASAEMNLQMYSRNVWNSFTTQPVGFPAATIVGHCSAQGALAIAAVPWNDPTTVEPFTSSGGWGPAGLPFYFSPKGVPLANAPQRRNKPDLAAPDGTSTSMPDFHTFYGTSAAAPQVAGAMALLSSIYPHRSQEALRKLLIDTAVDITTAPASTGPDAHSGHGLIDVAAAAIAGAPVTVTSLAITPGDSSNGQRDIAIRVVFSAPVTVTGNPVLSLSTSPLRTARYSSGSGTTTLTFLYSLSFGDTTHGQPLDAANETALDPADGRLVDADGNLVRVTLPVGSEDGSLQESTAVINTDRLVFITSAATPTNQQEVIFTCTFWASVSNFYSTDVRIDQGTMFSFKKINATTYEVKVRATTTGSVVTLSIPAGVATASGNIGNLPASNSFLVSDSVAPTLQLAIPTSAMAGATFTLTGTASEALSGLTAEDLNVSGGTVASFSGSGSDYTATIVAGAAGTLTVVVPANAATDLAGNTLAGPAQATMTITSEPVNHDDDDDGGCGVGGGIALILSMCSVWWLRPRHRWC